MDSFNNSIGFVSKFYRFSCSHPSFLPFVSGSFGSGIRRNQGVGFDISLSFLRISTTIKATVLSTKNTDINPATHKYELLALVC